MLPFYNYLIWFKVCRPLKRKYNLSVNCLLILSSCYIYYSLNVKPFTFTNILRFASFFNGKSMHVYLNVLLQREFIVQSGERRNKPVYIVSSIGNDVMNELNESYQIELSKFCNTYNIIL